ncbi:hypothetical protein L211DRAFT_850008 [Terfezia boudieri ATCC MYA-4762]|uniref:Uncharacterized protein n=1 Tax=Terfezia boudieri ATCC MYA-4762 TaxID=1051890 RepID=A0A3N4LJA7_9PEZI|nr:hypothetical protein L211DRAFT_850008 [Terfezia boudieri ATCC MYA-4762]
MFSESICDSKYSVDTVLPGSLQVLSRGVFFADVGHSELMVAKLIPHTLLSTIRMGRDSIGTLSVLGNTALFEVFGADSMILINTPYSVTNKLSSIKIRGGVAFTYNNWLNRQGLHGDSLGIRRHCLVQTVRCRLDDIGRVSTGTLSVFGDTALFKLFGADSMILINTPYSATNKLNSIKIRVRVAFIYNNWLNRQGLHGDSLGIRRHCLVQTVRCRLDDIVTAGCKD